MLYKQNRLGPVFFQKCDEAAVLHTDCEGDKKGNAANTVDQTELHFLVARAEGSRITGFSSQLHQ